MLPTLTRMCEGLPHNARPPPTRGGAAPSHTPHSLLLFTPGSASVALLRRGERVHDPLAVEAVVRGRALAERRVVRREVGVRIVEQRRGSAGVGLRRFFYY